MHLHTPERLNSGTARRFIDIARPDPGSGKSCWVHFDNHPELYTSNGSTWARDDVVRAGSLSLKVQKQRVNNTSTGKIEAMKCVGHAGSGADRYIPQDIKRHFKGIACVQTGAKSSVEIDHKNGRYNADAKAVADFQPLCRASNLAKRQACKECKRTGLRFDATKLSFQVPWIEGGEEFGDGNPEDTRGCHGCYLHDIARFVEEHPGILPRDARASEPGAAAPVMDTLARMRSIQYLGAKTKLLPSLLGCFDEVRANSKSFAQRGRSEGVCQY